MNRRWIPLAWMTPALVGLIGCGAPGPGTDPDAGFRPPPGSSAATIRITAPVGPDVIELGADENLALPIEFEVTGFELKAPGECAGSAECGHVHVRIDGERCNAPEETFNNEGHASPIEARFAHCTFPSGNHSVTVSLHDDAHQIIKSASGRHLSDTASIATRGSSQGPQTGIRIFSPTDGAMVALGTDADMTVPIQFEANGLTLTDLPGKCGGQPNCGVLLLNVDGNTCNDPNALGGAAPVNNFGATGGTIAAKFVHCPSPAGTHTLHLTVMGDDFQPLVVDGVAMEDSITITTTVGSGDPLVILSPTEGSTVILGNDADRSVPINFALNGVTLKPMGECAGAPNCGFATVYIDGPGCNDPNAPGPINNLAFESPTSAKFVHCGTPTGAHKITVTIVDEENFDTVVVDGKPAMVDINVTAVAAPTLAINSPAEGATVTLGADADQSVAIDFSVTNFTLMAPGTCAGAPSCGFVTLNIDGDACNDSSAPGPVNNYSVSNPISAKFAHCGTATGAHVVSLMLMDDSMNPVMVDGAPVQVSVNVTTE